MIRISDIEDIGNGQRQCRVFISKGMQTESGYVRAGEHYPFVIDSNDPYGLNPLVCDMLARGLTELDDLGKAPDALDHDYDGRKGGSLPKPPTI